MRRHEESLPHKNAINKFIETASKDADREMALKLEFMQKTGIALGSVAKTTSKPVEGSFYSKSPTNLASSSNINSIPKKSKPSSTRSTTKNQSNLNPAPWKKVIINKIEEQNDDLKPS